MCFYFIALGCGKRTTKSAYILTMKQIIYRFIEISLLILVCACHSSTNNTNGGPPKNDTNTISKLRGQLRSDVLTSEDQKNLTPDRVEQDLKDGNRHYVTDNLTANDYTGMLHHASQGQYPEAFILACIDSRVPVEEVFDKAIGDLFVGRVAGNFVDEDMLGSMEYGCKISGAKLIVVVGHESCGAIKAAIDGERLGNITTMLAKIKPALEQSKNYAGEQTSKNHAFVEYVVKNNIRNTIQTIRSKSPILKDMADKGEIKIVGAYYSLETGEVTFLNEK
jgi:carbonic anhydrase